VADLKARLDELASGAGVRQALVVGRDGFMIDASGEVEPALEAPAAQAASAFVAAEAVGNETELGALERTILEFEAGTVIAQKVGEAAVLVLFLTPEAVVGKTRHQVKEMAQAVSEMLAG